MGKGQRYKVVRKHLTCVVSQYSDERGFRLFRKLQLFWRAKQLGLCPGHVDYTEPDRK